MSTTPETVFEQELQTVQDEQPLLPLSEQVGLARERAAERLMRQLDTVASRRLGRHQELLSHWPDNQAREA